MIFTIEQIQKVCRDLDFGDAIKKGFIAYSKGEVVVPPVGELSFELPPGDTHIKYGYIKNDDCFVVKIASGFYQNPQLGLPSNSGLMLLFSQQTGMLESILLDEGYLTDVRTAVAGQIAAELLGPEEVEGIGVYGTGIQARMQVDYLRRVTSCRKIMVWGRSKENLDKYCHDMEGLGFHVTPTMDPAAVAAGCNLLVTTTPSQAPLLNAAMVHPGTHITAMGADTPAKQELDPAILARAAIVAADSIAQCKERGEIHHALKAGVIDADRVKELGTMLAEGSRAIRAKSDISVVDLTGVAVQDIVIAKKVTALLKD
jgi:ornithine cyclodeaminase